MRVVRGGPSWSRHLLGSMSCCAIMQNWALGWVHSYNPSSSFWRHLAIYIIMVHWGAPSNLDFLHILVARSSGTAVLQAWPTKGPKGRVSGNVLTTSTHSRFCS